LAALVEDGGTTKSAWDYLKWLFLPLALLPGGCAAPPERELVVIAISNGYDAASQVRVCNGYRDLLEKAKRYKKEHPELPEKKIAEPFLFNKGDWSSLKDGLARFGEKSITDLFIFGHGAYTIVISTDPERPVDPKYVNVGGITGYEVFFAVICHMKQPGRVRIEACWQRRPTWGSLNTAGISFSSPPVFEERRNFVSKGVEDMVEFAFTREGLVPGEYPEIRIKVEP
jgi:hypothetical protein